MCETSESGADSILIEGCQWIALDLTVRVAGDVSREARLTKRRQAARLQHDRHKMNV